MAVMRTLEAISLNNNWRYHFSSDHRSDFSAPEVNEAHWILLPMLEDWAVCASVQSGADWFRRVVSVDQVSKSLDYVLSISRVPETVSVYVNGYLAGSSKGNRSFSVPVTPFITWGENVIAMKLTCSSSRGGGTFGNVRLHPVPR